MILSIFSCTCWPPVCLWKNIYSSLLPLFKLGCLFFWFWVVTPFDVVQWLSCIHLFANPWTVACQASLSFTISLSLLRLMPVESVMPSNHLILCHPLLFLPSIFPASGSFPMSRLCASGSQSIGVSASVLPMNIQESFPFKWTSWISFKSKWPSRVFSNTTV